jgi:hypothetical protein
LEEVQHRTRSLFEMAKEKIEDITEEEKNEPFVASPGWWDKYSKRMGLGSVKLIGEAASADHEAAEKFPETLKKVIEEEGYSEDQVLNLCNILISIF